MAQSQTEVQSRTIDTNSGTLDHPNVPDLVSRVPDTGGVLSVVQRAARSLLGLFSPKPDVADTCQKLLTIASLDSTPSSNRGYSGSGLYDVLPPRISSFVESQFHDVLMIAKAVDPELRKSGFTLRDLEPSPETGQPRRLTGSNKEEFESAVLNVADRLFPQFNEAVNFYETHVHDALRAMGALGSFVTMNDQLNSEFTQAQVGAEWAPDVFLGNQDLKGYTAKQVVSCIKRAVDAICLYHSEGPKNFTIRQTLVPLTTEIDKRREQMTQEVMALLDAAKSVRGIYDKVREAGDSIGTRDTMGRPERGGTTGKVVGSQVFDCDAIYHSFRAHKQKLLSQVSSLVDDLTTWTNDVTSHLKSNSPESITKNPGTLVREVADRFTSLEVGAGQLSRYSNATDRVWGTFNVVIAHINNSEGGPGEQLGRQFFKEVKRRADECLIEWARSMQRQGNDDADVTMENQLREIANCAKRVWSLISVIDQGMMSDDLTGWMREQFDSPQKA